MQAPKQKPFTSADLYTRYTTTAALADGDDDRVIAWSSKYFRTNFSSLLPRDKDARIVELACGYGRYLRALSDEGYTHCLGVDISEEQVEYARNKLGLSSVTKADAVEWIKGKNEQFDCVLAIDFLEHLPLEELAELGIHIRKALRPGGRLILQVPNGVSPMNPIRYGDLTHQRAFTPQSIRQLLMYAGFHSISCLESKTPVYDWKTRLRVALWRLVLWPALHAISIAVHGKLAGGIYTSNIVVVAYNDGSV